MSKIKKLLLNPLKGKGYIYLLILNIISNMAVLYFNRNLEYGFYAISVSFISAYIENAIAKLFHNQTIQKIVYILWGIVHNFLIIADYYLIFQFGRIFNQDIVDILFETNTIEINNFVETYITFKTVSLTLLIITFFNILVYLIAKILSNCKLAPVWGLGVLMGISVYSYMLFNYVRIRDGMGITQYNAIIRVSHSFMILNKTLQTINQLTDVCLQVEATQTYTDKPTIILVIGESASVYHSYLYGYEKNTTPYIANRIKSDSLVVFDDIVSVADVTHKAMESVFSLNKYGQYFSSTPLFPAVFKALNYNTAMYDNQYFKGQGVTFMSDKQLSEIMFDYRNENRYKYDGDMVESIKVKKSNSLYVIHLWGQHYTYAQRYPKGFELFKPEDYDLQKYPIEKRRIIAHYDNATLYNDFVLHEIIKKFENENCCIIYLSDHGEEVFEQGDFMGHGGTGYHNDINYLVRVPFWIWMSSKYKKNHPEIAKNLYDARSLPGITDDVSHLLLDLAGIDTKLFSPSRSMANKNYDSSKPRIVLNTIDYDKK